MNTWLKKIQTTLIIQKLICDNTFRRRKFQAYLICDELDWVSTQNRITDLESDFNIRSIHMSEEENKKMEKEVCFMR